jgi:hypothetical protein
MPKKMLVGDKDTVLLIPAFEINGVPQMAYPGSPAPVPINDAGTGYAALFNYYIDVLSPDDAGAAFGGNITCAIIDDWNLAMAASDTSDVRTLCSVGQSQDLTFYNYDAEMNFLRDIDPTDDTSEFNLPLNLVSAPDVPYIIAHRIGYSRNADVTGTQEWHLYYVWTDHSVPASGDGDYLAVGQTFIRKGVVHFKAEVTA